MVLTFHLPSNLFAAPGAKKEGKRKKKKEKEKGTDRKEIEKKREKTVWIVGDSR